MGPSTSEGGVNVNNRVAGMSMKFVLSDHKDAVSALACFPLAGGHWMLSSGNDRRICLWDLRSARLQDTFRSAGFSPNAPYGRDDMAADGHVNDLCYAPELNAFAYASADKQAYIRRFSIRGDEMTLLAVLQGHTGEVTCIKWKRTTREWITASEDHTLRIWVSFAGVWEEVFVAYAVITQ